VADEAFIPSLTWSEERGEIFAAMAKAQASMGKLVASKTAEVKMKAGGTYAYSFAGLPDTLEACLAAFNAQGCPVIQTPVVMNNGVEITTTIGHTSGQWVMSAPLFVPAQAKGAQDVGSAITYARRYSLQAMVGLSPADDDGKAAQDAAPESWDRAPRRRAETPRKPKPDGLGPRCSGKKGGAIAQAIEKRLAIIDESAMGAVFTAALKGAEVDVDKYGPDGPQRAQALTIQDGAKVAGWLKVELGRRGLVEDGP
jgi:hypothetical protein